MAVPVEVVPFAVPVARKGLLGLGADVALRTQGDGPFESDNGNHILDARFDKIADARDLERRIDALPGVVDSGLFSGMADLVLVQDRDSFRTMERSSSA